MAAETNTAPDIAQCDALPTNPESFNSREAPIELPQEWATFAASSLHWIAVKTAYNTTHCIDTSWLDDASEFEILGDRFAGFDWSAYEGHGFILIDRSGQGHSFDTGAKPVFSPSGDRFAAMQVSDAGWGGFEGFGIWTTYGNGIQPIVVNTSMEPYPIMDWRVDRWEGEECVHISAVPYERINGDYRNLETAQRDPYVASYQSKWQIVAGETCAGTDET